MSGRRFTLYVAWDRPAETGADLGVLENRFPALFELRRAIWPHYEHAGLPEHEQGIVGFLDDVVLFDFAEFRRSAESAPALEQPRLPVAERRACRMRAG